MDEQNNQEVQTEMSENTKQFFNGSEFATAWCEPEHSHKEMDVNLALSIAKLANTKVQPLITENERLKARVAEMDESGRQQS